MTVTLYLDIIPSITSPGEVPRADRIHRFASAGAIVVEHNPQLVIISDIRLSDMDGRIVCERVKSRMETRNTRSSVFPV